MVRSARQAGFTLVEILVALTLGLLLSAGILSLFSTTSRTNKLQNGLARLQENGRFAVGRMETDLRMTGAQYCTNSDGKGTSGTVVPVVQRRAPAVLAADLGLPDPGPGAGNTSLATMKSLDANGYPSAANAAAGYMLSPRYFVQGYSCAAAGSCTPSGLPTGVPAEGTNPNNRLPASDVLTIRYLRGAGWPLTTAAGSCASGMNLTISPQPGDPTPTFVPGAQLVMVSDCSNVSILPVTSFASNTLKLNTLFATPSAQCGNPGNRDMRVFDFAKDFVSVTYYVGLRADLNPDARTNSPSTAQRVIPVLIRRENGQEQELVQGVDQLSFLYGVQDSTGKTRFLTASQVDALTDCSAQPSGVTTLEPGCGWRSVRTIEAHLLVNTVDEVFGLDTASRQYRFMNQVHATTDTTALPSTLKAGSMLRREFIAQASNRNYNF